MLKKIINKMAINLHDNYIYYSDKLKNYFETRKFVKKCTKKEKCREWQQKYNTEKIKRLTLQRQFSESLTQRRGKHGKKN